jgi:glucosamine-6-phosphate deaminase
MADSIKNTKSVDVVKRIPFGQGEALVFRSRTDMAFAAANAIAAKMRQVASVKPTFRMIFAAAPSQSEVLHALTAIPNLPWKQVIAFHMDDYLGLPTDAPQRFANWLDDHLFSKVPLAEVHRIPASGAPDEICQTYADKLAEEPIDIICLGIGVNGHIAFNDPPVADFDDPLLVKVVELDEICRQQQVDDGCFGSIKLVPLRAVTLTISQLVAADALFCTVPGAQKRAAVKAAITGPISTKCPASILRTHKNCTLFLDSEADTND